MRFLQIVVKYLVTCLCAAFMMFGGMAAADSLQVSGDQINQNVSEENFHQANNSLKDYFDTKNSDLSKNVDIMSDSDMKDTEGGVYGPYVCVVCGGRHGGVYHPNYCQWCYYK